MRSSDNPFASIPPTQRQICIVAAPSSQKPESSSNAAGMLWAPIVPTKNGEIIAPIRPTATLAPMPLARSEVGNSSEKVV